MDDLVAFVNARLADDERPVVTERMRREIAAKRAILAAYVAARDAVPPDGDWYEVADGVKVGAADGLEVAVKHAAAVWDGHPGYRPEWKP